MLNALGCEVSLLTQVNSNHMDASSARWTLQSFQSAIVRYVSQPCTIWCYYVGYYVLWYKTGGICLADIGPGPQPRQSNATYSDWYRLLCPGPIASPNFTKIGSILVWDLRSWTYSLPNLAPLFTDVGQPGLALPPKWFHTLPVLTSFWTSISLWSAQNWLQIRRPFCASLEY